MTNLYMMTPLMINLNYWLIFALSFIYQVYDWKKYDYEKSIFKIYLISLLAFAFFFINE